MSNENEDEMAEDYKKLKAQLEALHERTEAARVAELDAVVTQIRALVAEYGISEDQIYGRKRRVSSTKTGAAVEAKYQNPKTGETWSGRGRAPLWIRDSKNRERFLIAQ